MNQTVITDVGVKVNEGIDRDGENVAILADEGGSFIGGDNFEPSGPAMADNRDCLSSRFGQLENMEARPSMIAT